MEQTISTRHLYRTRLFLYTLIVVTVGALFAGLGVVALLPKDLGSGYGAVISTIQGIGSILMQKVVLIYLVIVVGIVIAMVILHLVYSHRIAGPAFRLSREAAKIGEGNLAGKIKFRQKDNLTDMADMLNEVADLHRGRIDALKKQLSQIEAQSDAINILVQQGNNGTSLEKAADDITAGIRNVNKILSEIRA